MKTPSACVICGQEGWTVACSVEREKLPGELRSKGADDTAKSMLCVFWLDKWRLL